MPARYIPQNHGAVIQGDTLEEIREFWKKLCESFPENRLRFSEYRENSDGTHIASFFTDYGGGNDMEKTYRLYTSVKKIGDDYYEAKYKELTYSGELVSAGTEDFSRARLYSATRIYSVCAYNGRTNKAGGKMTDCVGSIRISKSACAIKAARSLYNNVARVK